MNWNDSYRIASMAARDEANRHARRNGRDAWNIEDWNVAVDTFYCIMRAQGFVIEEE